jgi:hypothetical protein
MRKIIYKIHASSVVGGRIRIDFGCPGSRSVWEMWVRVQEHENLSTLTENPGFFPFINSFVFDPLPILSTYIF